MDASGMQGSAHVRKAWPWKERLTLVVEINLGQLPGSSVFKSVVAKANLVNKDSGKCPISNA
jgi:hypothetical protein